MKSLLALLASLVASTCLFAVEAPPYKEGPVVEISYVRTKPGMFDAYRKWVNTDRKAMYDEYKKAGLILGYHVFEAFPRSPSEPDVILTVMFANMAALDDIDAKTGAIDEKVESTRTKQNDAAIDREKLRTILGSELVRELLPN